jgi:hypothetical protein
MKKGSRRFVAVGLLAVIAALAVLLAAVPVVMAAPPQPYSQNVALVPDADGLYNHGGTMPTTNFPDFEDTSSYTPTFTNLSPDNIRDDAVDPIVAGGFDTVVLMCIEDSPNLGAYLDDATFLNRIHSFIFNGGKLIIYTSENASNPFWNNFVLPFETTNPGDLGACCTPFSITEENTLSSSDPTDYYYIDANAVTNDTDAVGDANVFTTYDPAWCEDMRGQNALATEGPVHAYATYGEGLVIYNALDKDFLAADSFTNPATTGELHLARIWDFELKQKWNPSDLPCLVPIAEKVPGVTTWGLIGAALLMAILIPFAVKRRVFAAGSR